MVPATFHDPDVNVMAGVMPLVMSGLNTSAGVVAVSIASLKVTATDNASLATTSESLINVSTGPLPT